MTGVKLYEIAPYIREIGDRLVENNGELTPELETELKAWQGAFDFKAQQAGLLFLELDRQAEMAEAEAKRLNGLAQIRRNAAERLKEYIKAAMESAGVMKVETDYCRLTIAKNPPRVATTAEAEHFYKLNPASPFVRRVPASYEWDKKAILEASKNGGVPEGVAEITQSTSLRIK